MIVRRSTLPPAAVRYAGGVHAVITGTDGHLYEGALVDASHGARGRCAAIVINAGAFSHYAYAITDALAMFDGVKIEVHLSNPYAREQWRHVSVVAPVVDGSITGMRAVGYRLAIEAAAAKVAERTQDQT